MSSRKSGACVECARCKRRVSFPASVSNCSSANDFIKCDQKKPSCTQCIKRGRECELSVFKPWKLKTRHSSKKHAATTASVPKSHARRPQRGMSHELMPSPAVDAEFAVSDDLNGGFLLVQTNWLPPNMHPEPQITSFVPTQISPALPYLDLAGCLDENLLADSQVSESETPSPPNASRELICRTGPTVRGLNQTEVDCWTLTSPSPALSQIGHWPSSTHALLWNHFLVQGSKMFLCFDPERICPQQSIVDPFASALVSMAVFSPALRLAALALSALLYGLESKAPEYTVVASRLGKQAWKALRGLQLGPSTRWSPLEITATALLIFLLNDEQSIDMLSLARKTAASVLEARTSGFGEQFHVDVILHLYRWSEICALLSLHQSSRVSNDHVSPIEFRDEELQSNITMQFRSWVIHPLYTFSHRWINPLLRLGSLTRLRRKSLSAGSLGRNFTSTGIRDEIDNLEETVLNARHLDLIALGHQSGDHIDLLHLNEALYSAFFILFYTRLRDMAWTEQIIRRQVRNICDQVSAIDEKSRTLNNVAFPLYVAGCEAVDMELRVRIEYLISRQHSTGYWCGQNMRLITSLRSIWEIRDRQPGIPWVQWINIGRWPDTYCDVNC